MPITRNCVQCGKKFTLSDSEIGFYTSKELDLPKRCKACRDLNKGKITEYNRYTRRQRASKGLASAVGAGIGFAALFFLLKLNTDVKFAFAVSLISAFAAAIFICLFAGRKIEIEEFDTEMYTYTFYDTKSMASHYVKHGREIPCNSMEEYLIRANAVIKSPKSLKKIQKEDGDTAYFNPQTNGFVVVAKAGYIRTYFTADRYYFDKQ